MSVNWRQWLHGSLMAEAALDVYVGTGASKRVFTVIKPDDIPDKPLVLVRLSSAVPAPVSPGWFQFAEVWCHDLPMGYKRIGSMLDIVESSLAGAALTDAAMVRAECTGRSRDLYDDGMGTITKYTSYRLVERRG